MIRRAPSFKGLAPASNVSSRSKRANPSVGTRHEDLLRKHLWRLGLRFRKNVDSVLGKPDVVFRTARVVVFCDGDFWHGRAWPNLKKKLRRGTNAVYWTAKIAANRRRDKAVSADLAREGWCVLRIWESDILHDPVRSAARVHGVVHQRIRCLRKRREIKSHHAIC